MRNGLVSQRVALCERFEGAFLSQRKCHPEAACGVAERTGVEFLKVELLISVEVELSKRSSVLHRRVLQRRRRSSRRRRRSRHGQRHDPLSLCRGIAARLLPETAMAPWRVTVRLP